VSPKFVRGLSEQRISRLRYQT